MRLLTACGMSYCILAGTGQNLLVTVNRDDMQTSGFHEPPLSTPVWMDSPHSVLVDELHGPVSFLKGVCIQTAFFPP